MYIIYLGIAACTSKKESSENTVSIPLGHWRASITTQGKELPFDLISRQSEEGEFEFVIQNGDEEIVLDKFDIRSDSLVLPMHIFDTKIVAHIAGDQLKGYWTKNYVDDYKLPFEAKLGEDIRFPSFDPEVAGDLSGRWEVKIYSDEKTTPAVGEFTRSGSLVTGTFLKTSGDYRFLVGATTKNGFTISTFDGEHAYLFEATMIGEDSIAGEFWSGKTGYYTWSGVRNEHATLSDPTQLVELEGNYKVSDLKFPNENGDTIRLSDEQYKGKVVILQALGSWCPNCMDETAFLSQWYKENSDRGVEIVGLAFERKGDFDYGASRIKILKDRYNIDYEIVFAGKQGAESVKKALPMIKKHVSYPTTIFVNKASEIAKIHAGFSGPGTGIHYQEFVEEFNETMDGLLEGE